jgi:26S proteasome regulatory subunit N13
MGTTSQQQAADKPFPFLTHLLPTSITITMIENASEEYINNLLSFLPPTILLLAKNSGSISSSDGESTSEADAAAARAALSLEEKRSLLRKVLRSPQFHQALGSLTMALRDGGLPSVSEALGIKVENGGLLRGGAMPLGGGEAVEAFVNGVKKTVQDRQ